jgi:broad specificity phosphatase PhoE
MRRLILLLAAAVLVAPAAHAQSDRLVILVRHAEADGEPSSDPPLTEAGTARAGALARALRATNIGTVIVSPRARTRLTAGPLLANQGLEPNVVGFDGGRERHIQAVAEAVAAAPGTRAVLVVGHSNTIPAIVGALGGPDLPDLCHGQYSSLFVMHIGDGSAKLVRGTYGTPDAPDAGECERS